MASIQRVCAWLNAAGRAEQRLLCVGDGRGDTQALGTLDVPPHGLLGAHAQRLARVRLAAGCAFRSGASAGVERPSVDTARQVATVQVLATGAACGARACGSLVGGGAGSVSSGGVGRAGVFCDCGARASQAHQAGQVARADGVLGSGGFGWGGWLAVGCVVGGVVVEVVAASGGGVLLDEERFWVGGGAVLGF